ncbi:10537_t:CDS:2 [Ambispora leptoticha]|uniref:10537_t:CDS:1 n=1 Tax=Ambispora leptoticha TaxID=144679 RepID=A0A9N8ZQ04_9GLOM|nr:10537_t:CDS:2 [Ambispora leptoticha]
MTINEEFTFNDLVKKTKPDCKDKITINLLIRIKGIRRLGNQRNAQYSSIETIPELDIDATFGTEPVLDGQEFRRFTDNLAKIASAFHDKATTNEATARSYINPFMVEAVAKVRSKHLSTMLAVEEDFGRKSRLWSSGLSEVPNIVDFVLITHSGLFCLHIATFQKRKRKLGESITKPPIICGIVSTGIVWQFLRWSGTPEDPTVKISKMYVCPFGGDMREVKEVVSIIIRVLQSQASVLTPQIEVETERIDKDKKEDEERLAKKHINVLSISVISKMKTLPKATEEYKASQLERESKEA